MSTKIDNQIIFLLGGDLSHPLIEILEVASGRRIYPTTLNDKEHHARTRSKDNRF